MLSESEVRDLDLNSAEDAILRPYFTTAELERYYAHEKNSHSIIYLRSNANELIKNLPHIKEHLDRFAEVITSHYGPYGLHRARDERFFEGEKVISLRKTKYPRFTYSDFPCYVSQTFNVIKPEELDAKYLTGLLNSRVCHFWLDRKGKKQGEQLQVDTAPLLSIPLVSLEITQTASKSNHDRMTELVARMIDLTEQVTNAKTPQARKTLQRQIKITNRQIDQLVYELYGLTDEEIEIVETATA